MAIFSHIAIIITLVILSPAARAQTVTDSRIITLCQQRTVEHVANAGAEYQPGVDVKGNPVTPADISVDLGANVYPLRIPLEMDLLERYNLELPKGIITNARVADIMVYEDGRTTYNGQDISSNIETFCIENEIIIVPPDFKAPQIEDKTTTTTTTSDGQVEIEPLAPPQEHEIIKGEYH